jgi:hypothetical protein
MAYEVGLQTFTLKAGADLSAAANQYKLVKLDSNGNAVLCAATTDVPIGVLQNTPANNDAAEIAFGGVSKVQAGAALAIGNQIGPNASGQAVALTPGTDTTKYVIGVVLVANANSGGYVTALINSASPHRAA